MPAGGVPQTIQLRGTIKNDTAAGTIITNTATIKSDTDDPTPANNTSTTTTTVNTPPPQPVTDLEVAKQAPATIDPGEMLTYAITVKNNGPDAAADVKLSDDVPKELQNVRYSLDNQAWSAWSSPLNLGTIRNGEMRTVYIRGTVASDTAGGSVLRNTAKVETTTRETNTGNNSATAVTNVNEAPQPCQTEQEKYRALTKVISSISAEEAATAHIIQEEAKKLKAAIAKPATPAQLLEVNESIAKMMDELNKNIDELVKKLDAAASATIDPSCPPSEQDKVNRQRALNNVIDSVADEEKAMAELMNAEAEKISAVTSNPNATVGDMVKINESASGIINKVHTANNSLTNKLMKAIAAKP